MSWTTDIFKLRGLLVSFSSDFAFDHPELARVAMGLARDIGGSIEQEIVDAAIQQIEQPKERE